MSETAIRLSAFAGAFAILALLEIAAPRREAALSRIERWPGAWALLFASSLVGRLIAPAGLAGLALWAQARGWGLLNQIDLSPAVAIIVAIVALDFAVWVQHVLFHRIDVLWRFHRVHHADPHLDVTTALRFHPGEIAVSIVWKGTIVIALGAPALAAFLYEILLNGAAQFNHANIRLPRALDRALRLIVVTPDMHRVHHSTDPVEHNRNFGNFLSLWDRLFRLYQAQPAAGHRAMPIGLSIWRDVRDQGPVSLLAQPFAAPPPAAELAER